MGLHGRGTGLSPTEQTGQTAKALFGQRYVNMLPAKVCCRRKRVPGWINVSHSLLSQPHLSGSTSFKERKLWSSKKIHRLNKEAGVTHQEGESFQKIVMTVFGFLLCV